MVKSYVLAIKCILTTDGYAWDDEKVILSSLMRACKLVNDRGKTCFPIQCGLLELILFQVGRYFSNRDQPYLMILYQALFLLGYYGLMRVGELTTVDYSDHTVKATNIHMSCNKEKLMVVLYSSKTHDHSNRPQTIKIESPRVYQDHKYKDIFVLSEHYACI